MRDYELILYGASSFTGVLVAEYFARTQPSLTWALAGRDRAKLEAVRERIAKIDPRLSAMPVIVADAGDRAALDVLATRTRVVCTTVGPYRRWGMPLVEACARNGTHYTDITGEVPFMRESIDRNHAIAEASGAKIVHACGFDSIPSDFGVRVLREQALARGDELAWAKGFVKFSGVGAPGGVESAIALIQDARNDRALRRIAANPHVLEPSSDTPKGKRGRTTDQLGPRFDRDLDQWTGPFVMAMVNTRVVRRSAALAGYDRAFRYEESMNLGRGPSGLLKSLGVSAAIGAFLAAASFPPAHRLLRRMVRPSAPRDGHYEVRLLGRTTAGHDLVVRIAGSGDPGCEPTAILLGESALALARGHTTSRAGVLTPATAFDGTLVDRLRAAGITFEIVDERAAKQAA